VQKNGHLEFLANAPDFFLFFARWLSLGLHVAIVAQKKWRTSENLIAIHVQVQVSLIIAP